MRRSLKAILLLVVGGISAAAQAVSVYVTEPNYGYALVVLSVKAVDFRSFRFIYFYLGKENTSFQLKNGKYHHESSLGGNDLSLGKVSYFSPGKNEPETASVGV